MQLEKLDILQETGTKIIRRVSMMNSQVIDVLFVVLASAAFSSAIRKLFFSLLCLVALKRPLLF